MRHCQRTEFGLFFSDFYFVGPRLSIFASVCVSVTGRPPGTMADQKQKKASAQEANAMADVNKYVEDAGVDKEKAQKAISGITDDKERKELEAKRLRERALAKVKVSKDKVELIMEEMELSRPVAERALKIHKDDVEAALRALVDPDDKIMTEILASATP